MQYGICPLGIVPLRTEPSDIAEMLSQLLYGEFFRILEERKKWSRVRTVLDHCEGWVDNRQICRITEDQFDQHQKNIPVFSSDLIEYVTDHKQLIPVPLGSVLNGIELLGHEHQGEATCGQKDKSSLVEMSFLYLNAPFLWGGKSPFGIDSGGFTQMVYRLNGYRLGRKPVDQARQGESLSFIEESEPGDLAFFDNPEGAIDHVGIIMGDNYIIHAYGQVRVDRIDHSGIYNNSLRRHTHKLRVIKKIF